MTDVYSHPDYQQFIARIRERPDDDVVRLVCADWLEDWVDANYPHPQSGEVESRAELIRVQCDPLYTVPCAQVTYPLDEVAGQESLWNMGVSCLDFHDGRSERQDRWCPQCKARHRVLQMIEAGDDDTTRHVPHPFSANGWRGFVVKTYDRGFVRAVRGPLGLLHGGDCGRCGGDGSLIGDPDCYQCHGTGRVHDTDSEYADGLTDCPNCDRIDCRSCHGTGRTPGILPLLLRREPIGCDGIEVTDRDPFPTLFGYWRWFEEPPDGRAEPRPEHSVPKCLFDAMYLRWPPPQRGKSPHFPTADAARLALGATLFRLHGPK